MNIIRAACIHFTRGMAPLSCLKVTHGAKNVLISDVANGNRDDCQIVGVLLLKPCFTQQERLGVV